MDGYGWMGDGWIEGWMGGNWHMKGKMEELIGTDRLLEDWVAGWEKGMG